MRIYQAIQMPEHKIVNFDSADARALALIYDEHAWIKAGEFEIEGTVKGLEVRSKHWVENQYEF